MPKRKKIRKKTVKTGKKSHRKSKKDTGKTPLNTVSTSLISNELENNVLSPPMADDSWGSGNSSNDDSGWGSGGDECSDSGWGSGGSECSDSGWGSGGMHDDDTQLWNSSPRMTSDTKAELINGPSFGGSVDDWTQLKGSASYLVLPPSALEARRMQEIDKVKSVLGQLPVGTVIVLLQHFRWNVQKLIDTWLDVKTGGNTLLKQLGLPTLSSGKSAKRAALRYSNDACDSDQPKEFDCDTCMDTVPFSDTTAMQECGHRMCNGCWAAYLNDAIVEKQKVIFCAGYDMDARAKCQRVIDQAMVIHLLRVDGNSEKAEKRFEEALIHSFVDDNPMIRWCPSPKCDPRCAIELTAISQDRNEDVMCSCGNYFCFRCSQTAHRPCSCVMMKSWMKKHSGADDSMSQLAIKKLGARSCPNPNIRCDYVIEKNGGCPHMQCKGCGYHFCWNCMGKFGSGPKGGNDGYSKHSCNKYDKSDQALQFDGAADLERFVFYSEGFNNAAATKKHIEEHLKNSDSITEEIMRCYGVSFAEASFYGKALHVLIRNRHVLSNSYTFGYYRPLQAKVVSKDHFEFLQGELMRYTDHLASTLGFGPTEKTAEQLYNSRKEIIAQTRAANRVRDNFLATSSGWLFIPDNDDDDDDDDSGAAASSSSTIATTPDWFQCARCTYRNDGRYHKVCELCGLARGGAPVKLTDELAGFDRHTTTTTQNAVFTGDGWSCTQCTFHNPLTRTTCEMCGGNQS